MALFFLVLRALAPLFLLIVLGSFLRRARVLHAARVPILNGLVISVTLPALIFLALTRAPALLASDARLPLALWMAEAVTMLLAYGLGRRLRLRGAALRFARSPLFLSVTAGLAARLLPWPHALSALPGVQAVGGALSRCLVYLSQGTTPLILLAVGVALQPRAALAAPGAALLPCLLKLVVCPLAMWGACRLLGFHGDLLRVGVLQAAMPTSVPASALCAHNDMEGALAVGVVFLTTTLSLLSLPLI